MLKSFIRDSVVYAIPSIVSRGLAVILIPLYTRVLTPADFGSLDLFIAFATLVNLTVALEVSQGVARFYSSEKDAGRRVAYASSAFWFTVFCYALFLIVTLIANKELSRLIMGRDGMETSFQVGVIYIFINGVFYLVQNQFRWEFRSRHYAVVSMSVTIMTAVFAVFLTYVLGWGLYGLLLGMAGGMLIGCIYGLWYLQNSLRFQFQWSRLKEMLTFSAPLVPSGIAVFITLYIDRLMINHFLSVDEVGLFGIGYRLASVVGLVIVGFQGALTPLIFSNYHDEQTPRQLAVIFRGFIVFSLLIFLSLSLFASEILYLMTTPAYYSAASIVIFLTPAILLSNMYIFAPGISIAKKTYLILYINIGGAVLNVALNWVLIPEFGISGAAIATLLSYTGVFFAYMKLSQKFYFVPHQWHPIFFSVVTSGLLAYWIPKFDISFSAGIILKLSVIVLACLFFVIIRLVKVSELRQLRAGITKRFFA
ncbi:MAG: oligosaccharide flippase family protein [Methylotenera sp.]|nr:oligosaccharide flippase family protein [Methylotenera sp.]MDO9389341.1 oligosaccharide flippase family protein [Methylotenera sp.]